MRVEIAGKRPAGYEESIEIFFLRTQGKEVSKGLKASPEPVVLSGSVAATSITVAGSELPASSRGEWRRVVRG
jgi:hypothetical protein